MLRSEFEALRDLAGKTIDQDIALRVNIAKNKYELECRVPINNSEKVDAEVIVRLNHETDKKTINVIVRGTGPICRLDVDGPEHPPAGRHHKHSLMTPQCPGENLHRRVEARPEFAGRSIEEVFGAFCQMARITHNGKFFVDPQYVDL